MKTAIKNIDRRQGPRYQIKGIVIAVARPPSLPPASIKVISQTGLTFHYRQNGNKWLPPQSIDIIWADYVATHHLKQIPVRTVSDLLIEPQQASLESPIRQFAVAFENPTSHQKSEIDRLISEMGNIKEYSNGFFNIARSLLSANGRSKPFNRFHWPC